MYHMDRIIELNYLEPPYLIIIINTYSVYRTPAISNIFRFPWALAVRDSAGVLLYFKKSGE